jgi:hypothetical protein
VIHTILLNFSGASENSSVVRWSGGNVKTKRTLYERFHTVITLFTHIRGDRFQVPVVFLSPSSHIKEQLCKIGHDIFLTPRSHPILYHPSLLNYKTLFLYPPQFGYFVSYFISSEIFLTLFSLQVLFHNSFDDKNCTCPYYFWRHFPVSWTALSTPSS